jgi:hypothetical protein
MKDLRVYFYTFTLYATDRYVFQNYIWSNDMGKLGQKTFQK